MAEKTKVLIVGAGPVGFLTALMLAKGGIDVEILEIATEIDERPRGAAYGPPAVRVLRRAGVLDDVLAMGIEAKEVCWRRLGGQYITGFPRTNDPTFIDCTVVLPVHLLAGLLYDKVKTLDNVQVHWGHRFLDLRQDDKQVTVEAENNSEKKTFRADFVVGCDGARSAVRKALFKDSFPGRTWDVQIVATNVRYSGLEKHGWSDAQWIVHPEHWAVVTRLDRSGLWRVAYGEQIGLDQSELKARLSAKLETILPGNPKEGEYELLRWSPFVMHQRCVERMQVGRVLLAGDAAHLCNPMGGLGLTGGIADVGSLVDALEGIHQGKASLKILEVYDQTRRDIYHKFTDPVSSTNLERLFLDGATALEKDPGLQFIQAASEDPVKAAQLLRGQDMMYADLIPYYDLTSGDHATIAQQAF